VTLHPQGPNLEINTLLVPLCQYCPQPRQPQQQSKYQVSVFFYLYAHRPFVKLLLSTKLLRSNDKAIVLVKDMVGPTDYLAVQ
jgi:hypothetical protein